LVRPLCKTGRVIQIDLLDWEIIQTESEQTPICQTNLTEQPNLI